MGYIGTRLDAGASYEGYAFNYGLAAPPGDEESGIHIEGRRHQLQAKSDWLFPQRSISSLNLEGTAQWYGHDEVESSGEIGTVFNLRTQTVQLVARTAAGRLSGAVGVSGLLKQYEATGGTAYSAGTDDGDLMSPYGGTPKLGWYKWPWHDAPAVTDSAAVGVTELEMYIGAVRMMRHPEGAHVGALGTTAWLRAARFRFRNPRGPRAAATPARARARTSRP